MFVIRYLFAKGRANALGVLFAFCPDTAITCIRRFVTLRFRAPCRSSFVREAA
jgi:hypothetical protein